MRQPVAPVFPDPASKSATSETQVVEPAAAPPTRAQNIKKFWREQIWPTVLLIAILFTFRSIVVDWNVVPTGSMEPTIIPGDRILVNKLAYDLKFPFTTWHIVKWADPQRGDIIVFDSPRDGTRLVKRVIGVPGDTVQMEDEHLIINGKPVSYGPLDQDTQNQLSAREKSDELPGFQKETIGNISHAVMQLTFAETPPPDPMRRFIDHDGYPATFPPTVVPPGQYFVMGDNRDNSADSRYFNQVAGRPNSSWIGFVPRDSIVGRSSRVLISLNYDNYYLPRSDRWFRKLP